MDAVDFFNAYDRQQQKKLDRLPVCEYCREPIQDDFYYEIDGEILCHDCLDEVYRKEFHEFYGE